MSSVQQPQLPKPMKQPYYNHMIMRGLSFRTAARLLQVPPEGQLHLWQTQVW